MSKIKIRKKNNNGYTIIETMVAIAVFLVLVMIGVTSLLNANLLHSKSQNMRSIMDNLSFIMDDMSRNLRTGYNYYCVRGSDDMSNVSIPNSGHDCWGFAFESSVGSTSDVNDQWVYFINNGKIFKSTQGPYTTMSNFIQLTPDEIFIDSSSSFSVTGAELSPDTVQPYVTIKLSGNINYKGVNTPFNLQTSISQRLLDK